MIEARPAYLRTLQAEAFRLYLDRPLFCGRGREERLLASAAQTVGRGAQVG